MDSTSLSLAFAGQPISLGDLISGLAEDHLPRHTQQLLALLPQDALLASSANGGGFGG